MSTIADIIVPETFTPYIVEQSVKSLALFHSGVITTNEILQAAASSGGQTINVPFWRDLGTPEPNISTDALGTSATPKRVNAGAMVARISNLNQGWESADLANELAGADATVAIQDRVSDYWARVFQKRLLASAVGVMADSAANHSGDMVIVKDEAFKSTHITETVMTMGENFAKICGMAVHPKIYGKLVDSKEADGSSAIQFRAIEGTSLVIPTYRGMALIIDKDLPTTGSGGTATYTTILFGAGAFGMAAGTPKNPVGVDRKEADANGGGSESLWSRVSPIIHPFGYKWIDTAVVSKSPTLAELQDATNWARVSSDRESVPLAFLTTKL